MTAASWFTRLNPFPHRSRRTSRRRRAVLRLETLENRTVPSTFVVSNLNDSGAGSLRQAILDADANPGADTVQFAGGLKGTINVTSGEMDIVDAVSIQGPGADLLTVNAGGQSRIFGVFGTSASIDGLTMNNGLASAGGAILNVSSSVNLSHVVFQGNQAIGVNGVGGAIFSTGAGASLSVTGGRFFGNQALAFVLAAGGAIANDIGVTTAITNGTFVGNVAAGGGFVSAGGAISNGIAGGGGSMTVTNSTFAGNEALGADGSAPFSFLGGIGAGGAILNDFLGAVNVTGCSFFVNIAHGGAGSNQTNNQGGGFGGAIESGNPFVPFGCSLSVSQSVFRDNQAFGGDGSAAIGGLGGFAGGGAIHTANCITAIDHSRFGGNVVLGGRGLDGVNGGDGAFGGNARGGAFRSFQGSATISSSIFRNNQAVSGPSGNGDGAGNGGDGSSSSGGAIDLFQAALTISDAQLLNNVTIGGNGGNGGALGGHGGAGAPATGGAISLQNMSSLSADHLWVQGNLVDNHYGSEG